MIHTGSILHAWARLLSWQVVGGTLSLLAVLLASKLVTPESYGVYGLMLSAVQVAYGVGFVWINHALFRYAREEYVASNCIRGALLPALLGHATLLCVAALLAWAFAEPLAAWIGIPLSAVAWCVAGVASLTVFEAVSYAAQACGQFRGIGPGQVLTKLGLLAMLAGFALGMPHEPQSLFLGNIAGWLAAIALTATAVPSAVLRGAAVSQVGNMLRFGWRLPLGSAAGVISAWFGVWFVRHSLGLQVAGHLAWAAGIVSVVIAALVPFSALLSPRMIDLRVAGRHEELAQLVEVSCAVSFMLSVFMPLSLCLGLSLGELLLPEAYHGSLPLIALLCAAVPAHVLSYMLSPVLMAYESQVGNVVIANTLSALLVIGGNVLLVPAFGAAGAAAATFVAVWVTTGIWLGLLCRLLPLGKVLLARWAAGGGALLLVMALLLELPPLPALGIALGASAVALLTARRSGALRGVSALASLVPVAARAGGVLAWCEGGR